MTRIFIDSSNPASQGARALAEALGARRIRRGNTRYRNRESDLVINWGNGLPPRWLIAARNNIDPRVNSFRSVSNASNKLATFEQFSRFNNDLTDATSPRINYPDYTTSIEEARTWVKDDTLIVSRSLLRASQGRGMVVDPEPQMYVSGVPTQLWVKYKRKSREFRVHVFNGKVIDVQQKKRRSDMEADSVIRSHDNGWIFAREGVDTLPEIEGIKSQAILAVKALGLDFGAVDVVYSVRKNKSWVLEVNTQPGLENSTVTAYANAIKEYVNVIL